MPNKEIHAPAKRLSPAHRSSHFGASNSFITALLSSCAADFLGTMTPPSVLSLFSLGACFLSAPVWSLKLDGLLQAREELPAGWTSEATPSREYSGGLSARQLQVYCKTSGWIPCTAYLSDWGCRPPGGTCCLDGNYCDVG